MQGEGHLWLRGKVLRFKGEGDAWERQAVSADRRLGQTGCEGPQRRPPELCCLCPCPLPPAKILRTPQEGRSCHDTSGVTAPCVLGLSEALSAVFIQHRCPSAKTVTLASDVALTAVLLCQSCSFQPTNRITRSLCLRLLLSAALQYRTPHLTSTWKPRKRTKYAKQGFSNWTSRQPMAVIPQRQETKR